jgi:competence protein ComEC
MKGLFYLIDQFRIQGFEFPERFFLHPDFASLKERGINHKLELKPLKQGDHWQKGGVDFEVLWPPDPMPEGEEEWGDNNQSLVLRVCYKKVCYLLTGDIEEMAEKTLLAKIDSKKIDVLKVAHHGSFTSTTESFLEKINPGLAILSAGRNNRYHLPHPEVIKRLEGKNIKILRTDRHGMIEVSTDGESVFYQTFIPEPIPNRSSSNHQEVSATGS